ncbi:MAG: type II secretion system F family protein [Selenomonadaceae bacterium]|nr:type II secretion system F family protein [Selenomonadaceae bacterium]
MTTMLAAAIGSIAWVALVGFLLYVRQTPEARVRKRMLLMINRAESIREREKKLEEASKPKVELRKTLQLSFYQRIVKPIFNAIEDRLLLLTPSAIVAMFEKKIFLAGKQGVWTVQRAAAVWVLSIALGVFLAFLFVQRTDYFITQQIIIMIGGGVLGGALPFAVLSSKIDQRQKALKRQLPEFLDLLCVSVQAGLSFDGAVAKITARMRGQLSEEFKHMQEDIKFGMTKQYALTQMAKRCDIEEMYLFTTSVIQAEKLGTSMAQTLTMQADNMRDRHRQFVKTQAMKAPIKILFPMVVFIFPAVFVVLLMPALLSIIKSLGK